METIQKQIDAASPILERIAGLVPVPDRSFLAPGIQSTVKKRYDKVMVAQIEEQIKRWQYATKTVLATCFSAGSDHYREFEHTIVEHRDFNLDAKQDLANEVNSGRGALSAIIEAESLKRDLQSSCLVGDVRAEKSMKPLVFISHSGNQKAFVKALVELFESCSFTGDNMFCSSVPGFNIDESDDIVDTLRKKFNDYNLYVIYVLSSDFFESPYCMNEVGAAWVLQAANSIIETSDLDESKIVGVISKTKNRISFKNDDDDILYDKMIELRNKILDFAGLGDVSESNWRRYYDNFLDKIYKDKVGKTGKAMSYSTKPALTITTESIDSIINRAINKLDEFTLRELEDETGFKEKGFLRGKIEYMVKSGELQAFGSPARRKYRRKL
jgi:hypothetical protein